MAFKKELYKYRPDREPVPIESYRTKTRVRSEPSDPASIERGLRQLLANKVSGNLLGLWLLVPEHLRLAARILNPRDGDTLVVADTEHYTAELIDHVHQETPFDLLVPIPNHKDHQKRMRAIPSDAFTRRWAGLATAKVPYQLTNSHSGPHVQLIQRSGERPEEYAFKGFLSTGDRPEADDLTLRYPERWHVEEFFNTDQALGWKRAGTTNLNIRYGQMTTGLIAQAAIRQFRQRLGEPHGSWDAKHLAHDVFKAIDGDLRVCDDTIVVTLYNAPNADRLRDHYEDLPEKLAAENVPPQIPWLYNFKLDFRFK